MLHELEKSLANAWSPTTWGDTGVLLAVSGGADSVAMLRAMRAICQNPKRLAVAHLNHRLRGQGSDDDETFVRELCDRLGVKCETARQQVDRLASQRGDGLEEAARAARYIFLRETAERMAARYVVTAHTADDQAETIMHRIIRGTGIGGLRGMSRTRLLSPAVTLIRPMLGLRRRQLVDYLSALDQPFRLDPSNLDTQFTRNRIRHDLLPGLAADYNTNVVEALLRLGQLSAEVQSVVDLQVAELFEICVHRPSSTQARVDTRGLHDRPPYIIRELLISLWREQHWPMQSMGLPQWESLSQMVLEESPPQTFPGEVLVRREGDWLVLEKRGQSHA
jgi:tRNA(Ile)-lysidine synthase